MSNFSKIKNQKKKDYFNIWKSLIIKKTIIEKLKKYDKKKLLSHNVKKIEIKKKIKSESTKKRNTHNDKNKTVKFSEKLMKNLKKELKELSDKKDGFYTRVNTERNIHNDLGSKII